MSTLGFIFLLIVVCLACLYFLILISIKQHEQFNTKKDSYILKNSEKVEKFLSEISSFKKENNFSYERALKIKDKNTYYDWFFWTNDLSLCSAHSLGEKDTNNLHNFQINYLWNTLRNFERNGNNAFFPLNYNEFDKFRGIKIPLKDIVYFTEKGEIIQNTSVSGGGSSLGGAIVGGVLAGGLGAIIGSRKKINSEVVTTDNREVYLVYYEGKTITKKKFGYEMLEVFDKLIPEKNYEFIQLQSLNSNLNKSKNKKKSK
jgi:hypothetical protein